MNIRLKRGLLPNLLTKKRISFNNCGISQQSFENIRDGLFVSDKTISNLEDKCGLFRGIHFPIDAINDKVNIDTKFVDFGGEWDLKDQDLAKAPEINDPAILDSVMHKFNYDFYRAIERTIAKIDDDGDNSRFFKNIYYEKYKKPLLIKNLGKHVGKDDGVSHVQVSGESIKPSQGGSWINPKEATVVKEVIQELKSNPKNNSLEIGVVTPYRKQADLITDELTKEGLIAGVSIGTAHIYQGQEKDIMIFSTVVSNGIDSNSALWLSKPPNLLNVYAT